MQNSYINDEFKHPILLPKRGKISDLSINPYNNKVSHGGCRFTTNKIRRVGYWITEANSAAKKVIFSCIDCGRLRGRLQKQKMAKLHACRLKETARFSHCGVDMFGLLMVKQRKSTAKWHGALFTCMSSPHKSYLFLGYRFMRLVAQWGNVRSLYSDNRNNLTKLKKETEELIGDGWQEN